MMLFGIANSVLKEFFAVKMNGCYMDKSAHLKMGVIRPDIVD